MAYAVLACIHSNLEALDAVLKDLVDRGITEVYCLGDIIGYGADPVGCLERVINSGFQVSLLGHHELAAITPDGESEWSSTMARRVLQWTRDEVLRGKGPSAAPNLMEWLKSLPRSSLNLEDGSLMVHGSPREPVLEYVLPEFTRAGYEAACKSLFGSFEEGICFCGHTHIPGVLTQRPAWILPNPGQTVYLGYPISSADVPEDARVLDPGKFIVNVGSVGQPRDRDWRACYATIDGNAATFHRVEYDIDATEKKLESLCRHLKIDPKYASRLRQGL